MPRDKLFGESLSNKTDDPTSKSSGNLGIEILHIGAEEIYKFVFSLVKN